MGTSLEIDDEVFHMAKAKAAENRQTLGNLVTEALRETMRNSEEGAPIRFRMPLFNSERTPLFGFSAIS